MKQIRKTNTGYTYDSGYHRCLYDQNGRYIGQFQENMLDDRSDFIWLETYPSDPCYHELTEEEMSNAIIQVGDHTPDLVPQSGIDSQ